jgi:hypothetical protein
MSALLEKAGVTVGVEGDHFRAACLADIDRDETLDVWTIDETRTLVNVVNDVTE